MNPSFEIERPDHFTAGAVGPKGQRVFYLQARQDGIVATFKVEKQQVQVLADYLERMLENLPPSSDSFLTATDDLLEPVNAEWVIGELGIGYDEDSNKIILHAQELQTEEDQESNAIARIHLERSQIIGFVRRARELVARRNRGLPAVARGPRW